MAPAAGGQRLGGDRRLGGKNGGGAAFRQAASALNLRPPDTDDLGSAADVCTGEDGGPPADGRWTRSGPVTFPADLGGTGPDPLAGLDGRGLDPLALRLVLLGRRYRDPLTVTWPALAAAGAELASWRGLVADWANLPSRPLSAAYRGRIAAAFDDDLDTPAALAVLRDLAADASVPAGARFETFADADRLFGLDLVRDVGRAGAGPGPPARHPPARLLSRNIPLLSRLTTQQIATDAHCPRTTALQHRS